MPRRKKPDTPYTLPELVRIFSQKWEVEYVEHVEKGEHLLGACDASRRKISLDTDQSEESMLDTLIHEMAHAAIAISPYSGMLSEEEEEKLVLWFTTTFISMVRENPELIKRLFK